MVNINYFNYLGLPQNTLNYPRVRVVLEPYKIWLSRDNYSFYIGLSLLFNLPAEIFKYPYVRGMGVKSNLPHLAISHKGLRLLLNYPFESNFNQYKMKVIDE
jgi:hypothetical protein